MLGKAIAFLHDSLGLKNRKGNGFLNEADPLKEGIDP
jgi:hypothetical protein